MPLIKCGFINTFKLYYEQYKYKDYGYSLRKIIIRDREVFKFLILNKIRNIQYSGRQIIKNDDFELFELYLKYMTKNNVYKDYIRCAYKHKSLKIIDYFEKTETGNETEKFNGLCAGGHIELINSWKPKLYYACRHGHVNIVMKIIKNNRYLNYNDGLDGACRGSHIELIKLMLKTDANIEYFAWHNAFKANNREIIKFLVKHTQISANELLEHACAGGHIKNVEFVINGSNLIKGIVPACRNGHLHIIKYLVEKGFNDYNHIFEISLNYGELEIVKYLVDLGIKVTEEDVAYLCKNYDYNHILAYFVELGITHCYNCVDHEEKCIIGRQEKK